MVWPALKVRKEIESTWSNLGFDASTAVGVHVRQTDKTSSNWWRNLLVQLAAGKVHADCTTVFLATDSLKVQKAFEQAQLSQRLITCPWGALPEDERPIHRSDLPGHWVLKTALYDLWTLAQCKEFIPAKGSSFSRLVSAWRSFPPA
jgi:hypothetical protein